MKLILTTIAVFCFITTYGANFHVAKNGDDDNVGSQSSPWKSIQYAMEVATPGSTVYVHEGFYNEPLYLEVNGKQGEQIVFTNFENDEVIIDAEGFSSSAIIEIYNRSYVTIDGFTVQNHKKIDAKGIIVEGDCKGISILNCTIRDISFSKDPFATVTEFTNAQPLIVYGTESDYPVVDLLIEGNKIYDCQTGYSEALAINGNVIDFVVASNEVYDISNIGIDIIGHEGTCEDPTKDQARNGLIKGNKTYNCRSPYATSAGIYVDGGAHLIIEGNEVYDNQWGIEVGCENVGKTSENILVRNNLVYRNESSGLHIGGYDFPYGSGKVVNCQVLNNTFYNNDLQNEGSGEIYLSYNENLVFMNNLIATNNIDGTILSTEDLDAKSTGIQISFNDWYNFEDMTSAYFYFEGHGYDDLEEIQSNIEVFSNNISIDPLFVSSADLHLSSESSLIDFGSVDGGVDCGTEDFDGLNRLVGSNIDLGAFEYSSSTSSIKESEKVVDFLVFPNPASDYICFDGEIEKATSIEIYDILGRLVKSHDNANKKVDIRHLEQGHYFINLLQDRKLLASKKLLIQH